MLAVERRNIILEKLQEDKRVVVSDLSRRFSVSEETIRRDLDKLHKDGLAIKSYGGAILNEDTNIDMPFNVRKKHNITGKQKIAEIVSGLIDDGDNIALDASTTAVFIAKAIKEKENLTVVTNSVELLVELSDVAGWNVVSTGGGIMKGYLALVGSRVLEVLDTYNVDKVILSCKGLDIRKGITEGNELFSHVKQGMIKSAKQFILAVDHSKFNKTAFSKISTIECADIVVTDEKPDSVWLDFFEAHGIRCIYPGS